MQNKILIEKKIKIQDLFDDPSFLQDVAVEIIKKNFNKYFTAKNLSTEVLSEIEKIPLTDLYHWRTYENSELITQLQRKISSILIILRKKNKIKKYSVKTWEKIDI